ncbi:MAG: nucleotide exchange factor GrpE [Vicinamibacteria bacterium]|nr:nucleotide exchange factor GrpE [Vicinamibacteria bacterium]
MEEERPDDQTEHAEAPGTPNEKASAEPSTDESGSLEVALDQPPEVTKSEAEDQRVRLAEDRLDQVLAAFRQLKVENEGYRNRTRRNFERRYEQRTEKLLLKFIDILDNFDRALSSAEGMTTNGSLFEGLILVRTQLLQMLQQEGLDRVPVLGLPFDPHVSEAVGTETVDDPAHHHIVVRELLRGYRVNNQLARPSRVIVGEYPCAEAEAQPAEARPGEEARDEHEEESGFAAARESPFDALDADITISKSVAMIETEATVVVPEDDGDRDEPS